jgi:hypothetical protein
MQTDAGSRTSRADASSQVKIPRTTETRKNSWTSTVIPVEINVVEQKQLRRSC